MAEPARKRPEAPVTRATAAKPAPPSELLLTTRATMQAAQISLFDLAPWGDEMRAMPNDLARAALFTTRNKKTPRAVREQHEIFHVNKDVRLTYTGIELRAEDDELVFLQVLEYLKRALVGEAVSFTFYELCQDLGWSVNGRYYDKAEKCLTRLQATAIQLDSARLGRLESVSLIHRFRVVGRGSKASQCQVEIDRDMVALFAGEHYSKFMWMKYRELSPTTRRLFDYFVTHKQPYPLKLETFRLMCGSDSSRPKKWREQAGIACEELEHSGLVQLTWVQGDFIHCTR